MLSYALDDNGKEPLYEQLYSHLRDDIVAGNIGEGERLPSRRSFAENLGVSTVTVENAYMQLEAEGYICACPRKGYFVEKIRELPTAPKEKEIQHLKWESKHIEIFSDLTGANGDANDFPFSIWSKLLREILNENREELLSRAPANGILPLRRAIAEHLRSFRGMCVDPEQIVIGAGTDYLYGMLVQLLGPDRVYAVEDPGYSKIAEVYKSFHSECRYIPLDKGGILPEYLDRERVDVVHISPTHHFPTGRVMPVARRHELLEWAARAEGRYIIEDEYDSEFRFNGRPIPPLQREDRLGRVIYINTFTKTLSPTIRISYMVLPQALMVQYREQLSFYSCTVSNFEQYALASFIERGYFEKHINRMRKKSKVRRNILMNCIKNSPLNRYTEIMEENAGLHFLMRVHTNLSDAAFCRAALEEKIRIDPLSKFCYSDLPDEKHIFVVNYAAIRIENIQETVDRLSRIVVETNQETGTR